MKTPKKTAKASKKTSKSANHTSHLVGLALAGLIAASSIVYVACDDSSSDSAVKDPPIPEAGTLPDGAPIPDGGVLPDGAPADGGDCFMNPTTHFEIINACTDAVKITKNPTLPLLLSDGGLPTPP